MTNQSLFILGRQPELGRVELESILGADLIEVLGNGAMLVNQVVPDDLFKRLGSCLKQINVFDVIPSASWSAVEKYIKTQLVSKLPLDNHDGKLQFGISIYGHAINPNTIGALGLNAKKQLRQKGLSVRVISPKDQPYLSSAQIMGNKMVGPRGCEVVFYSENGKTYVGVTTAEQDINAYSLRDHGRPMRDAHVGMLPPKLAQTIINLATGPASQGTLLDPFCGTGVLLQEASLIGFSTYGSDLEPRMIDFSQKNLDWLGKKLNIELPDTRLEVADATDHTWRQPINFVASEAYLGRAFAFQPTKDQLHDAITTCNLIIKKFLRNLADQIEPGTRLCLAVPAWQVSQNQFTHLPMLDLLEEMGYNRVSFEHAGVDELIYYRSDQVVGRELLIITRK